MERGFIMLFHSILIGIFLYFSMIFIGYKPIIAEDRSILLAAVVLCYMILFGHELPKSINKNIINLS